MSRNSVIQQSDSWAIYDSTKFGIQKLFEFIDIRAKHLKNLKKTVPHSESKQSRTLRKSLYFPLRIAFMHTVKDTNLLEKTYKFSDCIRTTLEP